MELDRLEDIEGVDSEVLPEPLHDESELTYDEALELTKSIKSTITAAWVLLGRAHDGKAYRALGYNTWEEYVRTEFDFSVRTSYRLLDKAEVVRALEEATPADTTIQLTNKQVQEIKRELPKIVQRVQQETEGQTPASVPRPRRKTKRIVPIRFLTHMSFLNHQNLTVPRQLPILADLTHQKNHTIAPPPKKQTRHAQQKQTCSASTPSSITSLRHHSPKKLFILYHQNAKRKQ